AVTADWRPLGRRAGPAGFDPLIYPQPSARPRTRQPGQIAWCSPCAGRRFCMCTLVALHRCTPDASLWVAANRDEFLDRPAEGPALRNGRAGALVAPLDRRAGGTWWGLNAHGVFAAITNRPTS